jgi:hypothetical protein
MIIINIMYYSNESSPNTVQTSTTMGAPSPQKLDTSIKPQTNSNSKILQKELLSCMSENKLFVEEAEVQKR